MRKRGLTSKHRNDAYNLVSKTLMCCMNIHPFVRVIHIQQVNEIKPNNLVTWKHKCDALINVINDAHFDKNHAFGLITPW